MTTFETTELDFDNIKNSLKAFLRRKDEFADYDFDASGLNNILDVLAYNTHYNALLSNFALNEAYLTSAQLRSSVISIAQTLGYNIRSRTASTANLRITLNLATASSLPSQVTLPAGTQFTTSIDGVSYTFQTVVDYSSVNDNGIYTFMTSDGSESIPIFEGIIKTKTFIVQEENENQVFVIPDGTIDTSNIVVRVFDSFNSDSFVSYTDIKNAISISPTSTHYRILETPNGYYELSFGDGQTTGLKPVVGNKVEIQYLSCVGPDANGASTFVPVSQIVVDGESYDLSIEVVAESHNGDFRQSIESIRQNAPLGFAAQQRLVTAEDYETSILTNYSSVSDVTAWGGEDNDPPDYGSVYIGLLFNDNISEESKTAVKDSIVSNLNENLAVLSIDSIFVDPVIIYLEIETRFNFNPDVTSITRNTIESRVSNEVETYVEENLQSFSGIFRKSNLATDIDAISPAILSTDISVNVQLRLIPITEASSENSSATATYTMNYPVVLKDPDDVEYIITSSSFDYNGQLSVIRNKLNSTKLQVVSVIDGSVVIDNIGSYVPETGKITLVGFSPGVISSGDDFIKITAVPANDSVLKPLRNYYFDIDSNSSFASAEIDS